MFINELPAEVVSLIGSYCAQADVVNLAIACPDLIPAIIPGIYQCIVVDPVPRSLYGAREWREVILDGRKSLRPASTVHTIAGIKQLLSTLAAKHEFAAMVRSFIVKGNLSISDNLLIPRLREAFRNLSRVRELEWTACPELPPELIAEFPNGPGGANFELQSLYVDLATRAGQVYPKLQLPNLRKLHVRPFLNEQVLVWLRRVVECSESIEEVCLCRFLDSKNEIGSSFAFVGMSDVYQQQEPCAAVSSFFGSAVKRHQLRRLELVQIDTTATDAKVLDHSVDLPQLGELALVGSGREDEFNHCLLAKIVAARPQLKRAELDWRASYSVTSAFLAVCCARARMLKFTIKELPFKTLECLVSSCPEVENLEIHIQCDFSLQDLAPVAKLKHVEVLKIPFNHNVHSWELAAAMPSLKVVHLILKTPQNISSSNDSPMRHHGRTVNMGLLTSGILDQWNDPYRSPLQSVTIVEKLRTNRGLHYVVVDGHVEALKTGLPSLETYEH